MPRLFSLLAVGALLLSACDATRVTPSTGEAGAAEAIDTVRVVIDGTTVTVTDLNAATPTLEPATVALDTATVVNNQPRRISGRLVFGEALAAELTAEAESHLAIYSTSNNIALATVTDSESQYVTQNLNDGDYPVGFTFNLTPSGQEGQVELRIRFNHFEGVAKTSGIDDGSATDFDITIPLQFLDIDG